VCSALPVIVSSSSSLSGAYPSLSRREARQQSSASSDPPLGTPVSQTSDSIPPTEASSSSPEPPLLRTPAGNPPVVTREPSLLMPSPPATGTFDQQAGTEAQGGHFRRVSDPPSLVSGRLPPLLEVPVNFNIPAPVSARDCEWSLVSARRIPILTSP
jgi:hypothetical protein